jgi:hypothetical protein
MRSIRRTIVGLIAATGIAAGAGVLAVQPAHAWGTPGCAVRHEYQRIHKGQTLAQVQRQVAAHGKRGYSFITPGYSHITQRFHICGSKYGFMDVELYRYDRTGFHVEDKGWYRF